MGVDILGIVKHNLNAKQAVELPKIIDTWQDVKNAKKSETYQFKDSLNRILQKKARWYCDKEMTIEALERIWKAYKTRDSNSDAFQGYDDQIDCFFGQLRICEKVVIISHSPEHKFGNINISETATRIIKSNRLIAKHLDANEILYCPDSAYPTSLIEEYAFEGDEYEKIKAKSIAKFGQPPKGINEGRKYMFFFDNINEELEKITEREGWEGYWKYNEQKGEYEFDKTYGM